MVALLRCLVPAVALVLATSPAGAQSSLPSRLSDSEFWNLFSTMSEQGG